eukprot:363137-Chlamydomonas_euryale.AAC.2
MASPLAPHAVLNKGLAMWACSYVYSRTCVHGTHGALVKQHGRRAFACMAWPTGLARDPACRLWHACALRLVRV